MKQSIIKTRKNTKRVRGENRRKEENIRESQFFHSAVFPLGFFNEEFFEIAIKETTRGFLEEN